MSKYSALRRRLAGDAGPSVEMTFGTVDDIVGLTAERVHFTKS